ncbi:MAG: ATP-dependent helicase [Actinobacteria bacterium]|nr:ATP-dependent helicase [Actinomycetota bacterium]
MFVLHGCWQAGLMLWAEGPARQPAMAADHPFAVDPVASGALVLAAGDVEGARTAAVALRLPTSRGEPSPSPLLPLDEPAPEPTSIRAWQVPALHLPPPAALAVLRDPAAAAGDGVAVGDGLRYLGALTAFALELARRGRVLPWAVPDGPAGPGYARAVWRPVLLAADATRTRAFVTAMPDAVHAASRPGERDQPSAAATVADALDQLTDAAVRASLARTPAARRRRPAGSDPMGGIAGAWRAALTGEARFPATPEQLTALVATLAGWQREVAGGAVRARFRLVEPPTADAADADGTPVAAPAAPEGPWRVELGLAVADEPSLAVDADRVWRSRGTLVALARHVDAPQETLLAELGRAFRLWPGLEPALRTARPTHVELDAAGAHAFLIDAAPSLAAAGFGVLLPSWWGQAAARVGVRAVASTPGQPGAATTEAKLGQDALVDFRWRLAIGDEVLTQAEIDALAEAKQPLVRLRGQWVSVDEKRLRAGLDLVTRGDQERSGLGDLLRAVAAGDDEEPDTVPLLGIDADGWLGDLLSGAASQGTRARTAPASFTGVLRPYQERGLSWLAFLESVGLGAILADDMGLGKTVQLLALFDGDDSRTRDAAGPTLLICPMSLVGNWCREAARFAPRLRVHVHHGTERPRGAAFDTAVAGADLVITTYALAARDATALAKVHWRRIVLDEAQAVKNAATKAATAIRGLPARHRIAVTGTPVENRLADLWSLMQFANPGLLGTAPAFRRRFAVPVERNGDAEAAARLRAVTQPFILRRLKTDRSIIADLPEKLEMEVACTLTREQASLYQAVVDDMLARVDESEGMERRGLVLATMTKLKQVCNHPAHLLRDGSRIGGRSGKLERLEETLEEVLAAGEKALLFTQFAEFGGMLRAHLAARFGCEVAFLHGGVGKRQRDAMVTRFQSGEADAPPLLVLSLKAGGTGLTLTAANHVIHVDRWWNPAVEDQASDRAHRIGQTKTVQVRKLVCAGTLEEKISAMIASKRDLAESVVGSGESWLTELSTDQIRELITLEAGAVVE